ncbi:potassium-tellurite ethidium and proflavin transporter [Burkholderia sp. Ac-20353]|nr:potassium-tellurite ethidium and proflavin transporter [Burkholderia sp. Ac-20353]
MTSTRQMTIPASHFGMVLGLAGLGQAWRAATRLWALPPLVGETLLAVAGLTWAVLIAGYMWQAIPRFEQVQAEFLHPVQGGTPALVSAATSLVAMAAQPYSTTVAWILSIMGIGWHVGFSLWHTGTLWQGGRNSKDTLPTVYLPGGGE